LRHERWRFEEAGLQVVLVGMGNREESEQFRRRFQVPFPLVCDPDQDLYRVMSLPKGNASQVMGPSLVLRAAKSVLRGNLPGKPVGDVLQMPGVVGVDTAGGIWFSHIGRSAADYAPMDEIFAAWAAHTTHS
jgi:hypothetical protein